MVAVNCEQVWLQISDYIDDDLDPTLRPAMDEHLKDCPRCASVLAGTRNVVELYSDERLFRVPLGYSWRMQRRLASSMRVRRGTARGWVVAFAAMALVAGTIAITSSRSFAPPSMRSEHSQPGVHVPRTLAVVITDHGKLFHVEGCPFLKDSDNPHTVTAGEALKEGYVPCVRCLGEYVTKLAQELVHKGAWAGFLAAR
ncbi:MAG TPA: zf-HC2 domain-containing protein [Terriglobales bacterium]|nr:zf-HC2 domain-containing protein [Terriglobales bacterium]